MTWMTGQEASDTYGYTVQQIDAAAASGACMAEYQGWQLLVDKWPTPGVNERQHIEITGGPNAGTWLLALDGTPTAAIPYHPSAAQLQDRLTALSNVGAGNCWVIKSSGWGYDLEWQQDLGSRDVSQLVPDVTALKPVTASVVVSTTTPGSATRAKAKAKAKR